MAGNIKQAAATLSMECSYLNKMLTMKDIRLPGPDSRIVIFGQEVFKLKYKLRLEGGELAFGEAASYSLQLNKFG